MLSIYINLLFISCQADGRWTRKNRYDLSHFLSVPLNLWKVLLGCLKWYQWKKKHIYFCPLFLSFDINTYSSRHDHETPNVNYLLSSIIICGRHHFFFIFFNLSKTRYTLLPGIKIINKLLCFNQATLLIW